MFKHLGTLGQPAPVILNWFENPRDCHSVLDTESRQVILQVMITMTVSLPYKDYLPGSRINVRDDRGRVPKGTQVSEPGFQIEFGMTSARHTKTRVTKRDVEILRKTRANNTAKRAVKLSPAIHRRSQQLRLNKTFTHSRPTFPTPIHSPLHTFFHSHHTVIIRGIIRLFPTIHTPYYHYYYLNN